MGNRAVVCFDEWKDEGTAVYLHWNGGRDSIEAFLKATRILMGGRLGDENYARGRLIMVMGLFFPGCLSFGVGRCKDYGQDQDNGVYVIDSKTMTIKDRLFGEWNSTDFVEQQEYNLNELTNTLIKLVNSTYRVMNGDDAEDFLPTAEEYDIQQQIAIKEKEIQNLLINT